MRWLKRRGPHIGLRYRYRAHGHVMEWLCQRGWGAGDKKTYPSGQDAVRYARAVDRERPSQANSVRAGHRSGCYHCDSLGRGAHEIA